jgi:hypothetical protein
MEGTLENKVAKASTMLVNATEDLRGQVGKARGSLARAREERGAIGSPASPLPPTRERLEERMPLVGLPP